MYQRDCRVCGKPFDLRDFPTVFRKNRPTAFRDRICRKCKGERCLKYARTKKGAISNRLRSIKSREINCTITPEWIYEQLEKQEWKCALTGLPMKIYSDQKQADADVWSIDRIEPSKGYVPENVRFILNRINIFRLNDPDECMYRLAEALLRHRHPS